ncbi:hypothetical protein, partial [Rhizobium leguminosarum]|uniref:hypothetical protein n=1 Tax=Rhizobium leguminosarum TaxID=384 RepID=UPI001A8CAD85
TPSRLSRPPSLPGLKRWSHQRSSALDASACQTGSAIESAPLTIGTIDRRRRYNYKLLISLQSHPATEANLDFSFVTAVLGVFSTNLPMGRLGSREALDWCAARI